MEIMIRLKLISAFSLQPRNSTNSTIPLQPESTIFDSSLCSTSLCCSDARPHGFGFATSTATEFASSLYFLYDSDSLRFRVRRAMR